MKSSDEENHLMPFIHKLVDPSAVGFRPKCNRYLFMICCSLMFDEQKDLASSIKKLHQDANKKKKEDNGDGIPLNMSVALNPDKIPFSTSNSEWENINHWEKRLKLINDSAKMVAKLNLKVPIAKTKEAKEIKEPRNCSIHPKDCPNQEVQQKIGQNLDNQFKFLLYLAERYQMVTTCDKERINLWLQALCKIDTNACVEMKGIRNDYAMLIVGYLMNNELKGPFEDNPIHCLPPLTQAIATQISKQQTAPKKNKKADPSKVPLNPASETVEAFMNQVPKILEGAFVLLSINGSMFNQ